MVVTDNNKFVRRYFEEHFLKCKPELIDLTDQYIDDLNLDTRSVAEQILLLHDELQTLNQTIGRFPQQEFIEFCHNDQLLFNLFLAQLNFSASNAITDIRQGFLFCEKRNRLIALLLAAKKSLPSFNVIDFITGKPNVIFYQLNDIPFGLSEDDYYTMRSRQTKMVLDGIKTELRLLTVQFTAALATRENKKTLIEKERSQLLNIFSNYRCFTPESLIDELSELYGCCTHTFPANHQLFYTDFCRFRDGVLLPELLTPPKLKSAIAALTPKEGKPCHSAPPLFCWSLIRYDQWLDQLSRGAISEDSEPVDEEKLFEQTWIEAMSLCDQQINAARKAYNLNTLHLADYIRYLLDKLDELRDDFNRMPDPTYYNLLLNPQAVKSHFLINCLFNDCGQAVQNLSNAMRINEEFNFFQQEMIRINKNQALVKPQDCTLLITLQIISLINCMFPDPETVNQLVNIFSESTSHLRHGRKPVLFVVEDLKVQLNDLFDKTISRFEDLLDSHPQSQKTEYLIDQQKNLLKNELRAKRSGIQLHKYFEHLKGLFELELKTIDQLNHCKSADVKKILLPPEKIDAAHSSFGFNKKYLDRLSHVVEALCFKVRLVDPINNSPADLIAVLTSKDLSREKTQIHIGCQTNEFKYILKKLKPWFSKLQYALIKRSGLFLTSEGKPLTDANLSNSKDEKILSKVKIDAIFQELQ